MNVYILSTMELGVDTARTMLAEGIRLRGVIGLSDREAAGDRISGFRYLNEAVASMGIDFVEVGRYDLSAASDKACLLALDIDVLIVMGWQRLVPGWLISHCKLGVVGAHGSPYGITGGRGRSPQNWALMLGKKQFFISIFRIDKGIDSGPVIDTRVFPLTEFDDIKSSYYKVTWLVCEMIVKAVRSGSLTPHAAQPQEGVPYYLPQRTPEDGVIDWSRTTRELYDFIRALTRPYPGALSTLDGSQLKIWRARPFDLGNTPNSSKAGEIARVFTSGDFAVRTGDGYLLVEDFDLDGPIDRLAAGKAFAATMRYDEQIRQIVERHSKKFPDLPVVPEIAALAAIAGSD